MKNFMNRAIDRVRQILHPKKDEGPDDPIATIISGLEVMVWSTVAIIVILGIYHYNFAPNPRVEPRKWEIKSDSGLPLKFTGVVLGSVKNYNRTMVLYRSEDGRYIFSTNIGGARWVVLGDQPPTSQQIIDTAGWSDMTLELLKDTGLPTVAHLPPRS